MQDIHGFRVSKKRQKLDIELINLFNSMVCTTLSLKAGKENL